MDTIGTHLDGPIPLPFIRQLGSNPPRIWGVPATREVVLDTGVVAEEGMRGPRGALRFCRGCGGHG